LAAYSWRTKAEQVPAEARAIDEILATLAHAFPEPHAANRLKADLLGPGITEQSVGIKREQALLYSLAVTSHFAAFGSRIIRT
jgi:hypothetical protein